MNEVDELLGNPNGASEEVIFVEKGEKLNRSGVSFCDLDRLDCDLKIPEECDAYCSDIKYSICKNKEYQIKNAKSKV